MCYQFGYLSLFVRNTDNIAERLFPPQTWQDSKTDEKAGVLFKPFTADRIGSFAEVWLPSVISTKPEEPVC